jgi:hypothetical protein
MMSDRAKHDRDVCERFCHLFAFPSKFENCEEGLVIEFSGPDAISGRSLGLHRFC